MEKDKNVNDKKIYVYMGTYKYSTSCDIEHGCDAYRVGLNDPKASYRLYRDIEEENEKIVPINECVEFERNNTVLFCKTYNSSRYYWEIKKIFEEFLVKNGKNNAIQRVLRYNNKKL